MMTLNKKTSSSKKPTLEAAALQLSALLSEMKKSIAIIKTEGTAIKDATGKVVCNPALKKIMSDTHKARKLCKKLGLEDPFKEMLITPSPVRPQNLAIGRGKSVRVGGRT